MANCGGCEAGIPTANARQLLHRLGELYEVDVNDLADAQGLLPGVTVQFNDGASPTPNALIVQLVRVRVTATNGACDANCDTAAPCTFSYGFIFQVTTRSYSGSFIAPPTIEVELNGDGLQRIGSPEGQTRRSFVVDAQGDQVRQSALDQAIPLDLSADCGASVSQVLDDTTIVVTPGTPWVSGVATSPAPLALAGVCTPCEVSAVQSATQGSGKNRIVSRREREEDETTGLQ